MAVLIMLLALVVSVMNSVSNLIRRSTASIDALASARSGFDLLNRTAAQATLNTYWDYDDPLAPSMYLRASDLQFLTQQNTQNAGYGQEMYFVAPETYSARSDLQSSSGLMNGCSFFVQYGGNTQFRPSLLTGQRYRYRLMFGFQPTESLSVFNRPTQNSGETAAAYRARLQTYWNTKSWISTLSNGGASINSSVAPIADNVIALIVWPRRSSTEDSTGTALSTDYQYDSQKNAFTLSSGRQTTTAAQLPPVLQITMVAISEAAAQRLDTGSATPPAVIETALQNKFTDVTKYQTDLDDLTTQLANNHIEFKIFTTSVPLRESKWSRAQ